jgi:hypothetical protein
MTVCGDWGWEHPSVLQYIRMEFHSSRFSVEFLIHVNKFRGFKKVWFTFFIMTTHGTYRR